MKAVAVGKKGGRRRAGIWRRCEKREDGLSTHGRRGAIKFGRKGTPLKGDRRRRRAIDSCPSCPKKRPGKKICGRRRVGCHRLFTSEHWASASVVVASRRRCFLVVVSISHLSP